MTIENNRLICEFYFGKQTNPEGRNPEWQLDYSLPIFDDYWEGIDLVTPENAQFANSWDWLMPVCRKITEYCHNESEEAFMSDYYSAILDTVPLGDIESAYRVVVEFVEWYNQQKSE